MIGGLGYVLAQNAAAYTLKTVAAKDIWVRPTERALCRGDNGAGVGAAVGGHLGGQLSARAVRSDPGWAATASARESMARLLIVTASATTFSGAAGHR